ncbi:ABC transporter permease [Frankia sp. AgB1.9]|uniref:ABC transporter permease n=1 Tax=unclassified Frankia TaxID=2632575 RepID=UPI001931A857|nr:MULTISPECIES: ABC transporter permease [unclassified Frankia]MBL7487699.1 ABC transporter permease [Frankia sp. AgW1.1]MBL7548058.1 ABC transporter permease [Frankia sp. AgB1.9]MBL7624134.1 ABC transporter permease [Frankia sp. AgB1.8]
MLQYIVAGLALGSIYAIASSALVVTFVSAGVFNFAFGSIAFFVARFYYWLNSEHHMGTWTAGVLSILVLAPALGAFLYGALFRHLRGKTTLVKLVATIGLSVALPPIANLIFGSQAITAAPGLAALTDKPYHVLGTAVTTDQVITYGFLIFVVLAGTVVLRFTDVGLRVRAMVDSEAMASLSGTNPGRVSLGVWTVSTALAGLAGILVAPTNGLSPGGMTALLSAAIAAMVAARLRSLPGAVLASLVMGVVTDVIQKYLPTNSTLSAAIVPSIPFAFLTVFLLFYVLRKGTIDEEAAGGGPLDAAIKPAHEDVGDIITGNERAWERYFGVIPFIVVAALPLIFSNSPYWLGLTASGLTFAITFLTFTVSTGEGGMLWLSQIIFAGAGALGAGQFVDMWHVPVLLAIFMAAIVAAVVGAIIGLLTIRLGDLYVGLTTLTFGLLIETLVFTRDRFAHGGLGVTLNRPSWAVDDLPFAYLSLGVFVILALLILNLRRSTSGLALRGVRDSTPAARTLGLSVVQVKVVIGAIGAFVAAIGGGMLGLYNMSAQPASYATFGGLVWLAVVVTMGVRSITAAAVAGVLLTLSGGAVTNWLPARFGEIPAILFGLGAIGVASNPEGVVLQQGRMIRRQVAKLVNRFAPLPPVPAVAGAGRSGIPPTGGPGGQPVAHAGSNATSATAKVES